MHSEEVQFGNDAKEKLSEIVCDETCKDIEDFLFPNFCTRLPNDRRNWRIVQDGHGKWREINTNGRDEKTTEHKSDIYTGTRLASKTNLIRGRSFSNHILNSMKYSAKSQSVKSQRQDSNYKALSTNTRANIFPGLGQHKWFSQSNEVYSESALKLGSQSGHDLQDQFYGITRDNLGAWNEASVHHERMKKAWDVYHESLAKVGVVAKVRREPDQLNTESNTRKIDNQTKNKKKVKKLVKKGTEKAAGEERQNNEYELKNEQIPPKLEQTDRDDDFWDFYEQPFVQSY